MKKIILVATAMLTISLAMAAPSDNASQTAQDMANKNNDKPLVGQDPATWTPEYLNVKDFKMCLGVENTRGWEGYCMPDEQPIECPDESWEQLQKMKLKDCQK